MPVSAKMASHMLVMPKALKIRTMIFTPIAKKMFCHTMFMHRWAIFLAILCFEGLLSANTISPLGNVPLLSCSSPQPSVIRMPCLLALMIDAKNVIGMLMTNAHGQLMTRKVKAR